MVTRMLAISACLYLIFGFVPFPKSHAMEFIFKDAQFSFEALRAASQSVGGGADIGEVLLTARRIKEGDDESWHREWLATAERLERTAHHFLAEGHKASAKEAYFRASNYYRSAEFFLHTNPEDPRILSTWRKSRDCFLRGARLSSRPVKPVEIPFEGTTVPGYLCLVDRSGVKRPLLIIHTGFDGTAEELYFTYVYAAVERGYNCLLFEGPGQGRVLREQKILFRPNWETVVTPVVNFAMKQKEVDPKRIALMGISFGGYLAPRAVAFEQRIKACIANGGVYDFHAMSMKHGPPNLEQLLDSNEEAEAIDKEVFEIMKKDVKIRWLFNDGMWKFGVKAPTAWMRATRPYHLRDVADKITCSMLIVDSEGDKDMAGQAKSLYEALRCPKEFMLFTKEEGAEEHCQIGALMISNERILNWLDKTLKKTTRK